jgi:hypothetical protein
MRLYFNRCRVCGQAHDVGAPHKFGKAADVRRGQPSQLTPEAIETLSSAFGGVSPADTPPTPIGASQRRPGRPKKIESNA